jgi:uracil-DNA glycosylase family 4
VHHNSLCEKCNLWQGAQHPCIQGRGNIHSNLLILGEAPGENEDREGIPFIGRAGKELQEHLNKLGVECYISNAVKCRPTRKVEKPKGTVLENRTPTAREITLCAAKTYELIDTMKPSVIITLGSIPLAQLLDLGISLNIARGHIYYHPQLECYIVPTWHPAYLLYAQDDLIRKQFYKDIQQAVNLLSAPKVRTITSVPKSLEDSIEIKKFIDKLSEADVCAVDIETTGLNPRSDRITDISFCMEPGEGIHIEWRHILPYFDDLKRILESDKLKVIGQSFRFDAKFLRAIGISPKNIYFDTMLAYHTLTMSFEGEGKSLYSLEIMSWILTKEGNYKSILKEFGGIGKHQEALKEVKEPTEPKETPAKKYKVKPTEVKFDTGPTIESTSLFDIIHDTTSSVDIFAEKFSHLTTKEVDTSLIDSFIPKKSSGKRVPVEVDGRILKDNDFYIDVELDKKLVKYSTYVIDKLEQTIKDLNISRFQYYSAMDADVTLRIYHALRPLIDKDFSFVFHEVIMPLTKTLLRLEENGILIDTEYVDNLVKENKEKIAQLQKDLFAKVGFEFNIASSVDLRNVIYTHLKVPVDPELMTKGGKSGKKQPSTDKYAIEVLAKKHPILSNIVEFRSIEKENSTYLEGFKNLIDPTTGRIHGSFLQHTAATGRLSASEPNTQNIPRANRIRNMIIPRPGYKFVTADLSQAELRILAMMSNDIKMQDAFLSGHDFHTYTACTIFGIDLSKFDKKNNPEHNRLRGIAKNINFGVAYQISAAALADDLNIPVAEAQSFIDKFYNTYSEVKKWIDKTMASVSRCGYVETVHGRRRYLPQVFSSNEQIRSRALRQAVNTPIQGTASDCACIGLIRTQEFLDKYNMKSYPTMIIHDEIVIETPDNEVEIIFEKLPFFMTKDIPRITIPLVADTAILDRWEK